MTAFMKVNGVTMHVADGSFSETPREIRTVRMGQSTNLTANRRARKHDCTGSLVISDPDDARWREDFIDGLGHLWNFDDLDTYTRSSLGLGPDSLTGLSVNTVSPPPKFGTRRLQVASGGAFAVTLGYPLWTVVGWKNDTTSGDNWSAFAINSSNRQSVAGSTVTSTVSNWVTHSLGVLSLLGKNAAGTNANTRYDQVHIYPCALPLDSMNEATAYVHQLPETPFMYLDGDCLRGRPRREVIFDRGEQSYVQVHIDGTFHTNGALIPFSARER